MNNKKEIKRFEVMFPFVGWTYGITIDQLKTDIASLETLGVVEIDIETESNYYGGGDSISIKAFTNRL